MGTSTFLDSGIYDGLFSSTGNTMYYPFFWGNPKIEIEATSADVLAGVLYGLPATATLLMIVFLVIGLILLIVGVALCVKGKSSTMRTEANRYEVDIFVLRTALGM